MYPKRPVNASFFTEIDTGFFWYRLNGIPILDLHEIEKRLICDPFHCQPADSALQIRKMERDQRLRDRRGATGNSRCVRKKEKNRCDNNENTRS